MYEPYKKSVDSANSKYSSYLLVGSNSQDAVARTQFKTDSQKRSQSHDFDNYLAQGTQACLEGDIDAVHANLSQAMTLNSAQHADILALYAKCLTSFGLFSQSAHLMRQAYDCSQNNLNYLDEAIYFYGLAGRFHQAGALLNRDEVSPDKAHKFSQLAKNIIEFMDEHAATDDDLEGLINITLSILRQNKLTVVPEQIEIDLYADEASRWFHYEIPLHESVDKVIDMNSLLADRSVEECSPQIIRGGFVPLFKAVGDE